jgi:hypothetical protein
MLAGRCFPEPVDKVQPESADGIGVLGTSKVQGNISVEVLNEKYFLPLRSLSPFWTLSSEMSERIASMNLRETDKGG